MKAPLEQELKYALTQKQYGKLLQFALGEPKHQINVYFDDTRRSLKKAGAGLRIRIQKPDHAFLTLKHSPKGTPAKARAGWHERLEWEVRLPLPVARAVCRGRRAICSLRQGPIQALRKLLPSLDIQTVQPLGNLETWRSPIQIGRFRGDLDQWKVSDNLFYELEVETSQRQTADKAVRKLFSELGIAVKMRRTTKLQTFFKLH